MNYQSFLEQKRITDVPTGFEPGPLPSFLFDFQRDVVAWACRRGRSALFEDCGLGKTVQELVWAQQVVEHTGGRVLILAPLCVAAQHVREGKKFSIEVRLVAEQSEVGGPGIYITNYEKLHRFKPAEFVGICLDESSILKAYDGATRTAIIDAFNRTPYRQADTATPAPNDYMELGNHAEFLGVMSRVEMLATFFVHDGGDTSKWRLKGHAEQEFWRWLCSWAVNLRKPSDLGYEDGKFKLPALKMVEHTVDDGASDSGYLFAREASTMQERRTARRESIADRAQLAAELATSNREQWVLWCNLNDEARELVRLTGFDEIAGATTETERERITNGFLDGSIRGVVTKGSIWGFGMNLQNCYNTALVGLSDSYEEFYQIVRRFWRFGQNRDVNAHVITSRREGAVLANVRRKESDAARMADEMVQHMTDISSVSIRGAVRHTTEYNPRLKMNLPRWLTA